MVDYKTFMEMNPSSDDVQYEDYRHTYASKLVSIDMTSSLGPQDDEFVMCLPSRIDAFDMSVKEWSMFPEILMVS